MDEASCSEPNKKTICREKFLMAILESESEKTTHYNVLTMDKYLKLIEEVEKAHKAEKRTTLQIRRIKRFTILEIGGIKKLVARPEVTSNIKHYLLADEIYDVLYATHVAADHGGRDRMLLETSKKFANITKEMIRLFLSMCEVCQQKETVRKGGFISFSQSKDNTNKSSQDLSLFEIPGHLETQEKKIKTSATHCLAKIGDNVIIPLPCLKSNEDISNNIAVILQINDAGLYKLGTKHGILEKLYCRTEFDVSPQKLLHENDVNQDIEIAVRTAPIENSVERQSCVRCVCTKSCTTYRCLCKKRTVPCNSKCHQNLPCNNK